MNTGPLLLVLIALLYIVPTQLYWVLGSFTVLVMAVGAVGLVKQALVEVRDMEK